MRRYMKKALVDNIHTEGATRFGSLWLQANEQAIKAAAYCGIDHTVHSKFLPTVVYFVLSLVYPNMKRLVDENVKLRMEISKLRERTER